jgi:hypothetical protein
MNTDKLLAEVFTKNSYRKNSAFVLCREADRDNRKKWIAAMKNAGMEVLSTENLLPGQDWEFEVRKMIEHCDFVFALFDGQSATAEGNFNKFVRVALKEQNALPEGGIKLIPVRLDTDAIRSRFEFTWLDVWDPKASEKLKWTLEVANEIRYG